MHLNVYIVYLKLFIVYLNLFKCIYRIFEYIFNVFIIYLNIFECIYSIFLVYLNAFIEYVWYVSMYFNVFESIWMYLLTLYLELHHHILIVTFLPCTPTYTFAFQWLPSYHAIPLHSFLAFLLICFNFHTIYKKITYQSLLFTSIHHPTFHIPHSTSHIPHSILSLVARSIAEPKLFFEIN
jgi:hypothetical protein